MSVMRQGRLVVGAVRRKLWMASKRVPRAVSRVRASDEDYRRLPPVVVTTVPKSGTHLVHQIVTALPGTVDYGTFLATRASYRTKPRPTSTMVRRIKALAPGEVLRAHLVHQPEIVDALRSKRAFVVFVYRDPRDVIVSQAHYLTDSAPWHVVHREFARRTPEQRIDVAIDGLPGQEQLFPDVSRRFDSFAGWLEDADVGLRFEDLVGDNRPHVVRDLVARYLEASGAKLDVAEVAAQTLAAIDPGRSHTYREGRVGAWREAFSPKQVARFEAVAGDTRQRYGYTGADETGPAT